MLSKTDAIVLKTMRYGDTSKIVTLYTREFGKLKGIAKGARTKRSKFGAGLEPMSHVSILLYKKEQRDLHLLSQSDILDSHKNIGKSIDKMEVALSVVELVNQVTHQEERNEPMFSLIRQTLEAVDRAERESQYYFSAFVLRLSSLFGYALALDRCSECGDEIRGYVADETLAFQVSRGALICPRCLKSGSTSTNHRAGETGKQYRSSSSSLKFSTLEILRRLQSEEFEDLANLRCDTATVKTIAETLTVFLRYHFENLKPLHAATMFQLPV